MMVFSIESDGTRVLEMIQVFRNRAIATADKRTLDPLQQFLFPPGYAGNGCIFCSFIIKLLCDCRLLPISVPPH